MNQLPTFTGFPPAALGFLADLAANNHREWFEAHKATYRTAILEPALAFTLHLGERLQTLATGITYDLRTNGSGSIMRIYRDVRFSPNKSPYKTNLGIVFWEGVGKKTESPGFYFHMEAGIATISAGLYRFPPPVQTAYREAVADPKMGSVLASALDDVRGAGYSVGGEHYQRVPRGYDRAHPRADLLRHNGLYTTSPPIEPAVLGSPELVEVCFAHCRAMAPVHQWLGEMMPRPPRS